ncbi:MAG: NTP transferase domain-containing protein [Gemmatimonadales bacterium]
MRIGAVVLAAGKANRYGRDKISETIAGRPLLHWVVLPLVQHRRLSALVIVTRPGSPAVAWAMREGHRVVNGGEDMSASIGAGVHAIAGEVDGAFIVLADQAAPGFVYDTLIDAVDTSPASVFVPTYDDTPGNPVLFRAEWFEALTALGGDSGAKSLYEKADATTYVDVPGPMPPDLDSPADLPAVTRFIEHYFAANP